MNTAPETTAILAVVAFVAGVISSIAGSGGLLTLPALLSCGLPSIAALATNKLQSALGTLSSAWNFHRRGMSSCARCARCARRWRRRSPVPSPARCRRNDWTKHC